MQMETWELICLGAQGLRRVASAAMARERFGIGGSSGRLAVDILFGGIVLTLALAVGLGSKDVVRRSWERREQETRETEQPFHHL